MPVTERLAALDDEDVRVVLTPEHRAELRTSISAVLGPRRNPDQQHEQAMAEWRAKDAAQRAEVARLKWPQTLAVWGLVPLAVAGPAVLAAGIYGWGPLGLLAAMAAAPWLPLVPLAALAGAALCAWLAVRAEDVQALRLPCAVALMMGLLLLAAARSLSAYVIGNGVMATEGPPMVVRR
jgi:hypothetical protein